METPAAYDSTNQETPKKRNVWLKLPCRFCKRLMFIAKIEAYLEKRTEISMIKAVHTCPQCHYTETLRMPRALAGTIVDEQSLPVPEEQE